jgi:hypothetical protein
MRFLIRVAFWLSIVVLLLPTGSPEQPAHGPQISTVEAFSAAGAAVSDMRQFCSRQPDACTVGSHAATAFGQKAQASAKMVYEFFAGKPGRDEAGSPPAGKPAVASADTARNAQNTLTAADRSPAWRGSQSHAEQFANAHRN